MKPAAYIPALAVVLSMLGGCATTSVVSLDNPEVWMAKAQDDLLGKHVTMVTSSGTATRGKITSLGRDSLSLLNEFDGSVQTEPLSNVATIQPRRNTYAVLSGLGGGAVIGGVTANAISAGNANTNTSSPGFGSGAPTPGSMFTGALIGGAAGGLVLSLATQVTDYVISPGESASSQAHPGVPAQESIGISK